MIYEHRSYTVVHGRMEEYLERFERDGLPLLKRHLERLLAFHVAEIGPLNEVVHIWAFDSLADRERRRAALEADPAWQAFKVGNRGSFVRQEVKVMRPAPFCPSWF